MSQFVNGDQVKLTKEICIPVHYSNDGNLETRIVMIKNTTGWIDRLFSEKFGEPHAYQVDFKFGNGIRISTVVNNDYLELE